jgi:hypothetical protein
VTDKDRERELQGYLCSWANPTKQVDADGNPYYQLIDRHAFDGFLATHPENLRMGFDHEVDIGHFAAFYADNHGLRAIGVVKEGPAGDLVLEAADDGRTPGFSFHGFVRRYDKRESWQGLPVYLALEVELLEAGPVLEPADSSAVIEFVAGRRPYFRQLQDAHDRDRQVRALFGQRPPVWRFPE